MSAEELLSELEQTRLKEVFDNMDGDKDGFVTVKDLKKACHNAGFDIEPDMAEAMFARADPEGTGKVDWPNFAAAMVRLGVKILILFYLRMLFDRIDSDNTGFISLGNLKEIAVQSGLSENVTDAQLENLFSTMDESGDGKVDFRDFLFGLATVIREKLGE